jgi:hypothetical protein
MEWGVGKEMEGWSVLYKRNKKGDRLWKLGGGGGWEGDRIRMFEAKYSPDGSTRNGALRNTRIC